MAYAAYYYYNLEVTEYEVTELRTLLLEKVKKSFKDMTCSVTNDEKHSDDVKTLRDSAELYLKVVNLDDAITKDMKKNVLEG